MTEIYVKMTDEEYEEYKKYLENKNPNINDMSISEILELKEFRVINKIEKFIPEACGVLERTSYEKDKTKIIIEHIL